MGTYMAHDADLPTEVTCDLCGGTGQLYIRPISGVVAHGTDIVVRRNEKGEPVAVWVPIDKWRAIQAQLDEMHVSGGCSEPGCHEPATVWDDEDESGWCGAHGVIGAYTPEAFRQPIRQPYVRPISGAYELVGWVPKGGPEFPEGSHVLNIVFDTPGERGEWEPVYRQLDVSADQPNTGERCRDCGVLLDGRSHRWWCPLVVTAVSGDAGSAEVESLRRTAVDALARVDRMEAEGERLRTAIVAHRSGYRTAKDGVEATYVNRALWEILGE